MKRPRPHHLVSATPGTKTGQHHERSGAYVCACGEVMPGIKPFRQHAGAANRALKAAKTELASSESE